MMHMTFYWGKELNLLFTSWKTNSWPSYILTLLICFIFTVLFQYLEAIRVHVTLNKPTLSASSNGSIQTPLIVRRLGKNWRIRLASAAMFGVRSAVGYLIMLAIMSYNGGLFFAVIMGLMVGYYLFKSDDEFEGGVVDYVVVQEDNSTCACS